MSSNAGNPKSATKAIPTTGPKGTVEDRQQGRIEVSNLRLNATLVIINDNRASACMVPLKDFSKTGAGIYTKFKVDEDLPVRLSIDGATELSPLEGHIVWCLSAAFDPSAPPGHTFRLGLEFIPKDDQDRDNQVKAYEYISKLVGNRQTR